MAPPQLVPFWLLDKAEELVALAKQKILDENLSSEDDIRGAILEAADELGVKLTDEQVKELTELFVKIKDLDLDINKIKEQAEDVYNKIQDLGVKVEEAEGIFAKIVDFFESLARKIANLF